MYDIRLPSQILLRQILHRNIKRAAIKTYQETAGDYPEAQEESIASSSSLHNRKIACRHMERCKSDSLVPFLSRQVCRDGNEITDKRKAHLPFTKKKDVYTVFFRVPAILYLQKIIPTFSYFFHTWKSQAWWIKVRNKS